MLRRKSITAAAVALLTATGHAFGRSSKTESSCSITSDGLQLDRLLVRARLRKSLWALSTALAIAPGTVAAQDASSSSAAKLPEIHVIATTPVAPPPRRAPVVRATGPATRAPATRAPATRAPAAPAPAPAEATTAKPIPGAVDQDKIPANVQTAGAPDFSYTV